MDLVEKDRMEGLMNRLDKLEEVYPLLKSGMETLKGDLAEALALLTIINAEWTSDPMSVQCFDLRVVAKVKQFVEKFP